MTRLKMGSPQVYTDVGVYYAPGRILSGEVFDGTETVHHMENWLIENHGFQPQYSVSELSKKNFWRMFDASLYDKCRSKYGAVGTFMRRKSRMPTVRLLNLRRVSFAVIRSKKGPDKFPILRSF
ncbi:hypothetical protein Dimus_019484 [Dionaea muscipula]